MIKRHFGIFLQGLAVIIPVVLTIWVLYASVIWLDNVIRNFVSLPPYPLFGAVFAFACIWVVGLLMRLYLFRQLVAIAELLLNRVPLVKTLYGSVRDLMQFFGGKSGGKMQGAAVRVNIDDTTHMIGISTSEDPESGRIGVYLPLSYQIGGFLVYFPREKVVPIENMDVESALKHVLTGGMGTGGDSEPKIKLHFPKLPKLR